MGKFVNLINMNVVDFCKKFCRALTKKEVPDLTQEILDNLEAINQNLDVKYSFINNLISGNKSTAGLKYLQSQGWKLNELDTEQQNELKKSASTASEEIITVLKEMGLSDIVRAEYIGLPKDNIYYKPVGGNYYLSICIGSYEMRQIKWPRGWIEYTASG